MGTDLVNLNHCLLTRTTFTLHTTTLRQREDFENRFNVHQSPLNGGSSGAQRLEPAAYYPLVPDHNHWTTVAISVAFTAPPIWRELY
ncbi:hypothetical protein TNCV_198301 [Trichonephila clavipes]|nr:hypothetical protein TNCV_198301 [Trichonephila clavipes]